MCLNEIEKVPRNVETVDDNHELLVVLEILEEQSEDCLAAKTTHLFY